MIDAPRRPRALDRDRGIFETMRVIGGRIDDRGEHVERLRSSIQALAWPLDDAALRAALHEGAAAISAAGRLRVEVRPDGQLSVAPSRVEVEELAALRRGGITLCPVVIPGGMGSVKWVDRDCLEGIATAEDEEALILDEDGTVLETGRGNLFLLKGGQAVTPVTDGRILPGVTRRAAIAALSALERRIDSPELASADSILVTGTVRGVLWCRKVRGIAHGYRRPGLHEDLLRQVAGFV